MNLPNFDVTLERLSNFYRKRRGEIERLAFASSAGFSTYVLLNLTSYFPDNWVLLLSALNFFVGLKNTPASFLILLITFSISLIYQNAVVGIVVLLILLFSIPAFDGTDKISQALLLSIVPLMYYRVEFFPIIASALLYGYSNGLKRAILAFFGGLFFSNVLPYKNFGHFTLEFDYSIIQALKPKVSSLTLSNVIDLENLNPDAFYGFFDTITSSQLLLIMFISYVFVGVFPGYVRDAVEKFGRFWLLLALLISSYVVFFFINNLYHYVPGFELTVSNILSLMLSLIAAWFVYIIISHPTLAERKAEEEGIIMAPVKEEQEVIVSEGTRVDALRKELEEGEED